MRQRPFGSTGEHLSIIGQGTWAMEQSPRESVRALRRGLDLGLRHVDTAEMYGDGRVEELVGEAIAGRRGEVFLASKVLPQNATRRGTVEACEGSLRRLGTDHLDLYLLHWESSHPLAGTIGAFRELQEAGKIRHWGVSNFDEVQTAEAARIGGSGQVAANQVLYHAGERAIEHKVIPCCAGEGIAVVAYSPFGSGSFPAPESPGGQALAAVAAERGATPRQVALAFLLRFPEVFVIPKASRSEHTEENAGAAALALGEEEIRRLESAFPLPPWRPGVPVI